MSSIIIRPMEGDPNSTRLTILLEIDVKGHIPHAMVNAFMEKEPHKWQLHLAEYYRDQYAKKT